MNWDSVCTSCLVTYRLLHGTPDGLRMLLETPQRLSNRVACEACSRSLLLSTPCSIPKGRLLKLLWSGRSQGFVISDGGMLVSCSGL